MEQPGDEQCGSWTAPLGASMPSRLLQRDPPAPLVGCAPSAGGGVGPGAGARGRGGALRGEAARPLVPSLSGSFGDTVKRPVE